MRQTMTPSELFMLAEHYDTGKVQCWSIFFFLGIDSSSLLRRKGASCELPIPSLELLAKPYVILRMLYCNFYFEELLECIISMYMFYSKEAARILTSTQLSWHCLPELLPCKNSH